jgi:hypothetical protein
MEGEISMRILWHSNAPWTPTGYGEQSRLFIWRLKALGHDVTVSCSYGLQGRPITLEGITLLPMGRDQYSQDVLAAHAATVKADIVITLYDTWVMEQEVTTQFRWYPWVPVDCEPLPH